MGRYSQPQGLPDTARAYLDRHAFVNNLCSHCNRHDGYVKEEIGESATYGMCEEFSLYRYQLAEGGYAEEFVQFSVWDSGPMEWLGLRLPDGTTLEWPEDTFSEWVDEGDEDD